MPSERQVRVHADIEAQRRAQEAGIAQQQQNYTALLHYHQQSGLMAQQAAYGQQAAQQSHGHAQEMAVLHTDLQGRLSQVQLNQQEEARRNRMHAARASVEDDPDLAPEEKRHLIVQIESGLNPLEDRQREAQILQSHLQSQAQSQQTDQAATLFNQRQQRLAAGLSGRMQVLTDPLTGRQQLFGMDLEGNMQPLDFSQSQAHHEAQLQAMQAQTQATQQGTAQSAELQPGRVQQQGLQNATMQETLNQARQVHPLNVEHGQLVNQQLAMQIEQNPAAFNLQQLQGYAHLGNLQQQLHERLQTQPYNVGLAQANTAIAQMNMLSHPNDTRLRQAAQVANIAHTNAVTQHTNAIVANMPSVAQAAAQHGAESVQARLTTEVAGTTLRRLQAGGLPDVMARDITDHAISSVDREIAHAETEVQRLIPGTEQHTQASGRLEGLRTNRRANIERRANDAEDLMRRQTGMPGANRPPAANQPPPPNQNAAFDQLEQQAAALPAAQRQAVAADLQRARAMRAAFPGGFQTMPRDMQLEVMRLIERIRNAVPAGAQRQGPPAPGFLQGINQRFGGG